MTARRQRLRLWMLGLGVMLGVGGGALALVPHSIGAQVRAVPRADELALNESKAALAAVRSQVAATSDLPPEATRLTARISAAVQAQEREVLAGNEVAARQRHKETSQAFKRLGVLLQRHLAPPAAVPVDMAMLVAHFERLSERHHLLADLAAETERPVVDATAAARAENAAQTALNSGSIETARTSLEAYLAAIDAFEDVLFLRSQRLAP